jgi:hypothetical protein
MDGMITAVSGPRCGVRRFSTRIAEPVKIAGPLRGPWTIRRIGPFIGPVTAGAPAPTIGNRGTRRALR